MKDKLEMRLAGSGGQGVILGTIILAEAALLDDKYAAQSQSYGPEARGGMCKAEVVMSRNAIDFPKVECADFLLALTQASLDRYIEDVREDAVIMIDSSLKMPKDAGGKKIIEVPILDTAKEVLKKPMVANIVAVGAINACLNLVSKDALEKAVLMHVPKGTEELNKAALEEGYRIAG